jgi:heptosyltransferase-2
MKRIAVFVPNWVGDVVMATPAFRALRESFPHAEIRCFGRQYVADVLAGNPWFDKFHMMPKKIRTVLSVLTQRHDRFDVGILFPNSLRSAILGKLIGCTRLVGYDRGDRGWLLDRRLYPKRSSHSRIRPVPIVYSYARLVESVGARINSWALELFTTIEEELLADRAWEHWDLDAQDRVVLFHPGGAFGNAKHWPIAHFASLARQLIDQFAVRILVLCGPNEIEIARQIVLETRRWGIHSLGEIGPSLGLTKACVRRSQLLVTTDSGPRHIAAAFGVPCIALFGPTFIDWTKTFARSEVCLQFKVPCGPCQKPVCWTDHQCMRELRPDVVFEKAARFLRKEVVHAA